MGFLRDSVRLFSWQRSSIHTAPINSTTCYPLSTNWDHIYGCGGCFPTPANMFFFPFGRNRRHLTAWSHGSKAEPAAARTRCSIPYRLCWTVLGRRMVYHAPSECLSATAGDCSPASVLILRKPIQVSGLFDLAGLEPALPDILPGICQLNYRSTVGLMPSTNGIQKCRSTPRVEPLSQLILSSSVRQTSCLREMLFSCQSDITPTNWGPAGFEPAKRWLY